MYCIDFWNFISGSLILLNSSSFYHPLAAAAAAAAAASLKNFMIQLL